jgi:hypothetical protein
MRARENYSTANAMHHRAALMAELELEKPTN